MAKFAIARIIPEPPANKVLVVFLKGDEAQSDQSFTPINFTQYSAAVDAFKTFISGLTVADNIKEITINVQLKADIA